MTATYRPKWDKNMPPIACKLHSPKVITLWPTSYCNFRCNYCLHGEKTLWEAPFMEHHTMEWQTFIEIMEQIGEFEEKPESIVFCGVGEPLLNQRLADMVYHIKKYDLAYHTEVTTNGSLLTEAKSMDLLEAGLDSLNVSMQGLTRESYEKICGFPWDVDQIYKQVAYYYKHKKNGHLHVKAVDIAFQEGEEEDFIKRFSNICDSIHVDYAFPLFPEVDYTGVIQGARNQYTGEVMKVEDVNPCPLLSFALFIKPRGDVVPCCIEPAPVIYGNVFETSLKEIWDSKQRFAFLQLHLSNQRGQNPLCKGCYQPVILK